MGLLVWIIAAALIGCGYCLRLHGKTDHRRLGGQVLVIIGCMGIFGGLFTAAVKGYAVVGVLIGFAVGIAQDDHFAQKSLRDRVKTWLDKPHWKDGPEPRHDAPPL